jgi:hypothetical protein
MAETLKRRYDPRLAEGHCSTSGINSQGEGFAWRLVAPALHFEVIQVDILLECGGLTPLSRGPA